MKKKHTPGQAENLRIPIGRASHMLETPNIQDLHALRHTSDGG